MKRILRTTTLALGRSVLALVLLLACCQNKIIYYPRGYDEAYVDSKPVRPLTFNTAQGRQVAWVPNRPGTEIPASGQVWLVFSGNGTRALEMVDFMKEVLPDPADIAVLVDYPGYGQCQGRPTPAHIQETTKAVVPAIAAYLHTTPKDLNPRLRVFGHSLGCAAALMAMNEHGIQRGVLIAPFTSMMDMARRTVGWPLCEVLHHRFDNVASLRALQKRGGCHLEVIHGSRDEVIPQVQGQTLARDFPDLITFHSADQGMHNHILSSHLPMIQQAVTTASQD